ncbi:hypothetical protein CWATWH0005_5869 [Crocosphaera watsonii WH 0005]|uniref:Uncharacterized protein n=1 Tax=Crocosphaera watsonii WH 0005 TaxID=423472 RepID=T2IQT5_CROWT|nr:hypothetical protein CWATWH0005_5869 [Crocosphaera watsonii WH 0005]
MRQFYIFFQERFWEQLFITTALSLVKGDVSLVKSNVSI